MCKGGVIGRYYLGIMNLRMAPKRSLLSASYVLHATIFNAIILSLWYGVTLDSVTGLCLWWYLLPPVWPDWAIYFILCNFSKPVATIILPKSPTFLGNFCQGLKIFNFSSEIIFGQLLKTIGRLFTGHTSHNFLYSLPPPLTLVIRIPFVLTRKCTYQSDSIFIPVPVLGKA